MAFTTGWKALAETPDLRSGEGDSQVADIPMGICRQASANHIRRPRRGPRVGITEGTKRVLERQSLAINLPSRSPTKSWSLTLGGPMIQAGSVLPCLTRVSASDSSLIRTTRSCSGCLQCGKLVREASTASTAKKWDAYWAWFVSLSNCGAIISTSSMSLSIAGGAWRDCRLSYAHPKAR